MMSHRERILHRILLKNFLGAVLVSRTILPDKIKLFDASVDVFIEQNDANKDRLIMNYGDFFYTFDIVYKLRIVAKDTLQYIIISID